MSTTVSGNISSGFSMCTTCSFRTIEHKHDEYRGKDSIKKYSEPLREHALKIINFKKEKKEIIIKNPAGIIWKCKNML